MVNRCICRICYLLKGVLSGFFEIYKIVSASFHIFANFQDLKFCNFCFGKFQIDFVKVRERKQMFQHVSICFWISHNLRYYDERDITNADFGKCPEHIVEMLDDFVFVG